MSKIDVVTGASSGVGRALCLELAQNGRQVLGVARRPAELESLRNNNPDLIHVVSADISSADGRDAVWRVINGQFDVGSLVHSAAVALKGYLKDMDLETFRSVMAINLEAPIFLTQRLLPAMAQGARVLNLSSGAAHRAMEYNGSYCISKAALLMSYKAWNADFPGHEIVFGSAMPGVVEGPMQDEARQGDYPGVEMYRGFKDDGLLIKPQKVAAFLCWLLLSSSDDDFSSQDWNIFDTSHHARWLQGKLSG